MPDYVGLETTSHVLLEDSSGGFLLEAPILAVRAGLASKGGQNLAVGLDPRGRTDVPYLANRSRQSAAYPDKGRSLSPYLVRRAWPTQGSPRPTTGQIWPRRKRRV